MQIARVAASQQPVASTSAIASASAMLRLLNHHFNSAYQYAQLVFGPGGLRTREPSDADLLCVTVIQSLLEERKSRQLKCQQEDDKGESQAPGSNEAALADVRLAETRMLLKDCVALDSLLRVTDADGWNIVQAAAMNGDIELLDLLVAEGFDVNTAKCSLPLHVAAFLGNIELVDWLLARGADPAIERGMCFPDSHHPIRHVPSRFHFLETDIFACDAERHVAVMYAVQRDHVHVVRRFFSHADSSSQTYWLRSLFAQKRILHYACKQGAYHCLEYLVEQMNDELDTFDDDGFAPIHYAVRWSTRFVECLVNASINVHALSRNSQETALHRLFGDLQNPLDILETTTFLLGVGMEQKISVVDRNGNSVLHAAVSLVNRKLQSFPTMAVKEDDAHLMQQERYDNAVVAVLELLLQNNCDVGVVNSSSITALHKLLLIFDFVVSNEPAGVTLETLPVRENYKVCVTHMIFSCVSIKQNSLAVLLSVPSDCNITCFDLYRLICVSFIGPWTYCCVSVPAPIRQQGLVVRRCSFCCRVHSIRKQVACVSWPTICVPASNFSVGTALDLVSRLLLMLLLCLS